jgi:hypothetical protein
LEAVNFTTYCYANNGDELVEKVNANVKAFFPPSRWTVTIIDVEQAQQKPVTQRKWLLFKREMQPSQILFKVTVVVFPMGLDKALVCLRQLDQFKFKIINGVRKL